MAKPIPSVEEDLPETPNALAESEERFRALVGASFEGLAISVDGIIVEANVPLSQMLGYSEGELIGRSVVSLATPESGARMMDNIRRRLETPYEATAVRKDGSEFPCELLGKNARWRGLRARVTAVRDLTARKEAERHLRESEARYRELTELLPIAVIECDLDGRLSFVNRFGLEAFGYEGLERIKDTTIFDHIAVEDHPRAYENWALRANAEGGRGLMSRPQSSEYRLLRRDGSIFPAEVISAPVLREGELVGVRSVVVDLTGRVQAESERQRLYTRMLEAQKLESLGVLAGGIAHDFNNLLTVLMGNAELALYELPEGSPGREYVLDIERAAQSAATLTRQMLAYAGKASVAREEIALNGVVRKLEELLELSTKHRARIELHLSSGLPWLRADPHQIRQILLNLVTNAVEASGERAAVVHIETRAVTLDAEAAAALDVVDAPLPPGRYVTLAVSDEGRGMSPATRRRVFEPFFSTKFTGRGLGLAAVLGIVRSHSGGITIEGRAGGGTVFTVYLPVAVDARVRDPSISSGKKPPVLDMLRGRVLVVDDEREVALLIARLLRRLGLDVEIASSGARALELLTDHGEGFGCVLLDATMPGMSGSETFSALRRLHPTVPVVLCSGYADRADMPEFEGADLAGFISKPFELRSVYTALVPIFL